MGIAHYMIKSHSRRYLIMKRVVIIFGILLLVGAIAAPVMARGPGWGMGGQMGGPPGGCPGYSRYDDRGYEKLTEEQKTQMEKLSQKFYDETAKIRTDLIAKKAELNILMDSSNADLEKAKALQKEISDLKAKLAQERLTHEFEVRKINPDARSGWGPGRGFGYGRMGFGRHMRGYGPGSCWN